MRPIIHSLILLAVLAGPLAHASPDQGSATTIQVLGGDHASRARLFAASAGEPDDGDVFGFPGRGPANAQGAGSRKTVFKLHPLPMVGGLLFGIIMLPLEMEFAVTPNLSLYAMGTPLAVVSGSGAAGIAVNGGLRGYFSGKAPEGFWLGAQLGATVLASSSGAGIAGVDLQPQIGYQWVSENGFTIGLGAGLSIGAIASGKSPLTFQVPIGFAW